MDNLSNPANEAQKLGVESSIQKWFDSKDKTFPVLT